MPKMLVESEDLDHVEVNVLAVLYGFKRRGQDPRKMDFDAVKTKLQAAVDEIRRIRKKANQ